MTPARVADLTIDEFRDLMRQVVSETISEMIDDPDAGLELRDEIKVALKRSIAATEDGEETVPVEVVAARLGLKW